MLNVVFRSDSQLANQITVLNQDYAGSGLTFTLAGTTRTVNSQWFNQVGPDSSLQTTMKSQVRFYRPWRDLYCLIMNNRIAPSRRRKCSQCLHCGLRVRQRRWPARLLYLPL